MHVTKPRVTPEVSWGSIGSMITVIGAAVSVALYVSGRDAESERRSFVNQTRIIATEERVSRLENTTSARLDRIEDKIDLLIRETRDTRPHQ